MADRAAGDTFDRTQLLAALRAFKNGDFSIRLPNSAGIDGQIAEVFNDALDLNAALADQLTHIRTELAGGIEIARTVNMPAARGAWADCVDAVNALIGRIRRNAGGIPAEQLAPASPSRSEFLANMSHELRTPLSSLLVLAKLLMDNIGGNLTAKQIEYARTIYDAGTDLLSLINDILDLAKVESGTVTLDVAAEAFADVAGYVERTFRVIAEGKGLRFTVEIDSRLPAAICTDARRLQQILTNLLSNAIKFTERGEVSLRIFPAGAETGRVAFAVSDTGIGIPENKQKVIFEAFQQAGRSTSRYGGTGLGLSISRDLALLLGGEIHVRSAPGAGSTFTLDLPLKYQPPDLAEQAAGAGETVPVGRVDDAAIRTYLGDDRDRIQPHDRVVLIIEKDPELAAALLDLAREHDFKGVLTPDTSAGIELAKELVPDAIMANFRFADAAAWSLLDLLKQDPETWHIPVNAVCTDGESGGYVHMRAFGAVHRPSVKETLQAVLGTARALIEREVKRVLLATANKAEEATIAEALRNEKVRLTAAATGTQALDALRKAPFDCIVLGAMPRDTTMGALLEKMVAFDSVVDTPIVIYGPADPERGDRSAAGNLAQIVVLRGVETIDAVREETTLFLHQAVKSMPAKLRQPPETEPETTRELFGKKVLIVDDDIRNIFALTAVLEQHGMIVVNAETGRKALKILRHSPDLDTVLMDISMPGLDGYDAIRIIRMIDEFKNLPIIAVTARAMKGDREKCLQAGASDYIAKPVDVKHLVSVLRTWLS